MNNVREVVPNWDLAAFLFVFFCNGTFTESCEYALGRRKFSCWLLSNWKYGMELYVPDECIHWSYIFLQHNMQPVVDDRTSQQVNEQVRQLECDSHLASVAKVLPSRGLVVANHDLKKTEAAVHVDVSDKEVMITSLQPKTEIEEDSVVETLPDEDAVTFNEVDHEDDEMNADDEDGEEHDDSAAIAGENDSGWSPSLHLLTRSCSPPELKKRAMESHPSSSIAAAATATPRPVLIVVLVLAMFQIAVAMVHEAELAQFCSHYQHQHQHQHEESSTSSPHHMPSWCSQILLSLLPPPPPDEVDPRYGVEKRLVPTGPNPLHN
ncbi:hypothetical protein C4D60_Mb03t19550 [Musa balbisiana]|uniref:Uncharacterized protein n=1 Tax=Musa balbisiana TaxID=52838 RepID=A0A4S8JC58_MUSBA|nr:hypothetical protein C4D60_Mb03t19550 [Musa balbisiana]